MLPILPLIAALSVPEAATAAAKEPPRMAGATFLETFDFSPTLKVLHYRLDNGMHVLLLPDPTVPTVAEHIWVGAGSSFERKGATGIAHLFEHMMFRTTKNLAEGEFDRQLERAGGETNASTWVDWTFYRNNVPSESLEIAIRLDADRFQNLVVDDKAVKTELGAVLNERKFRVENSPDGLLWVKLWETAFQVHPYHHPTIGWEADLNAMDAKVCLDFYRTYYAPNALTAICVGGFDPAQALGYWVKHFGPHPPSKLPEVKLPAEPAQTAERRVRIEAEAAAEKLWIGYKIPAGSSDEFPALDLAAEVLMGGKSSRLHRRLVEEMRIATGVEGGAFALRDPALMQVSVNLIPGASAATAEPAVLEEIGRLASEGITDAELAKARNRLEGNFWRQMKDAGGKAFALGNSMVTYGDYRFAFSLPKRYRETGAPAVRDAAAKWLTAANRTVAVLVPVAPKGADAPPAAPAKKASKKPAPKGAR